VDGPGRGVGGERGGEQVAYVHHPDDVVEGLADHRVPRVGHADDRLRRLGERGVGVEERDLRARHHHGGELPVGGAEDVGEHAALLDAQVAVPRDHLAQLLLRDLLAARTRVEPQQPDHDVRRARQQPDHRAADRGDPVQRGRHDQRHPLRSLQRQPLGHQLPEDQRQVRDRRRHRDQRDRRRHPGGQPPTGQHRRERPRQRRSAVRRGEEPGQRHPDLDGGQEAVRVLTQARDPGAPAARVRQPLHLRVPQRHQCQFRGGEEAADQHEEQDQAEAGQDAVHRHRIPCRRHW
jgi:hypothetical protein